MDFAAITGLLETRRLAAFVYRRGGQNRFRDELTIGQNGRALFRRFNYGEAAGLVFAMWGAAAGEGLVWDAAAVDYGRKDEAPVRLNEVREDGSLVFDGARFPWQQCAALKSWPEGGLSRLRMLLGGR